jgi:uncharacterized protein
MSPKIRIVWPHGAVTATLRDTVTARQLLLAIPLQSLANTWGDEVYFSLPFSAQPEPDASAVVDKGSVCFWLNGNALALLFGPTPVSVGRECRLVSAANLVGSIDGDPEVLRNVQGGDPIRLEAI